MTPALIGVVSGILTIAISLALFRRQTALLFALLLTAAAAVYVGGAFTVGIYPLLESCAAFIFFLLLALRSLKRPMLLGFAWLLHAAWDMAHHFQWMQTTVPDWYQISCAAADLIWGAFLLAALRDQPQTETQPKP